MNRELIIKKRSLLRNNRDIQNLALERELRNSVEPEVFRDKLLEGLAKYYENVQS